VSENKRLKEILGKKKADYSHIEELVYYYLGL